MQKLIPIALAATLVGCSYAPPPPGAAMTDARAQSRLAKLLAGKVAGPPQSCLPYYRTNDMIVIDDYTLAYRDGSSRVWINKPAGGCNLLSGGPYALVTRQVGSMGPCRGDIAEVTDTMSGTVVGSCVMSDFVPYTKPGS